MFKKSLLITALASLIVLGACSQTAKKDSKSESSPSSSMMKDDKMTDDKKMSDDKMSDKDMKDGHRKDDKMKGEDKMTATKMNDGEMAPDFSLMGVDGKTYKLSDFKGKKVYIKFWASWCSICLSSLPATEELAKEQGDDYVVLSIVAPNKNGEKSEEDFKTWYKGLDYKHLPVLIDQDGQNLEAYGVRAYPSAAFIGSDGVLVKTHVGYLDEKQIKETLASIK